MRQSIRTCLIAMTLALVSVHCGSADEAGSSEVIILSTLHRLHEQIDAYSFKDLSHIIERLDPDVLAVELTAADLASRRDQPTKQEYQRSVFPLLDKHDYRTVPLEPAQPLYDELVGLLRESQARLRERNPQALEAFALYTDSLFQLLAERWKSPAEVNSRMTDVLFESKHRFQSALYGHAEARAWEEWNQHFLQQIVAAAKANPGSRILVLVGAEHSYWLRAHLESPGIVLLDTKRVLDSLSSREADP